ncbi:protein-L-isoaspartate(D-aspartate) O-methyltransferase [Phenylobacterium sp. LjRoot219]|uniref:protein-L-isoaspartate(D-aspartate) O-methyltransferase n=1 Tax=Phenylobacterium sp. LjRoot219 TaxID=3342283 RepID=UPI003ED09B21
MTDAFEARELMVERQLAGRGVSDARVLAAMREVPRDAFVPDTLREFAYADRPLPIGCGQTISQPYIVALMIEAAGLRPGDRVLEIGAGSGYAAAVMSRIAARVYAIERVEALAVAAAERLQRLGYDTVEMRVGDGTCGWAEAAPFDAILVAASGPAVPPPLADQLQVGGRLVMPVDEDPYGQRLVKVVRRGPDDFTEQGLCGVAFVPLIGAHGWAEPTRNTSPTPPTVGL